MMRLLVMFVVMAITGVWAYLSCVKGEMQPIDIDKVVLILGSLGFKAIQKKIETTRESKGGE